VYFPNKHIVDFVQSNYRVCNRDKKKRLSLHSCAEPKRSAPASQGYDADIIYGDIRSLKNTRDRGHEEL
jgi:hypothetical protein